MSAGNTRKQGNGNTSKEKRVPSKKYTAIRAWDPPTKLDKATHNGASFALNMLIVLFFLFNLYAQINLATQYIVVPEGITPTQYINEQIQRTPSWDKPYTPEHPVITNQEYNQIRRERLAWTTPINILVFLTLISWFLLRFCFQSWYRKRVIHKIKNFGKKGRV